MVGTLARLQLTLFRRGAFSSVARTFAFLMGVLVLGGASLLAALGLGILRGHSVGLVGPVTTLGFAVVTLGWPLVTLLVAGTDQTLDAGRFALFPVRARTLLPGLVVVSLMGLGGVASLVASVGYMVAWSSGVATALLAVVGAALGVLTAVLASRVLTVLFSTALASRRWRDTAAIVLGLAAMLIGVAIQAIQRVLQVNGVENLAGQFAPGARVVAWTPVGWAWSLPWAAAEGQWLAAGARLVLAAALVAGLLRVWERQLDRALTSPLESSGDGSRVKEHSLVDRMVPRGPAGAVAARSLRYWRRDPRHLILAVSILLLPFLMVAPMLLNPSDDMHLLGSSAILLYPVLGLLVMGAMSVAGEINYDGSALWMPISAGIRGRQDRWGRIVALLWLLVPLTAVLDAVFMALSRQWSLLPALVGGTLGALAAALGVGSVVGAIWQWPVAPPGGNAFGKTSGGGFEGMLAAFVNMVAAFVVALPMTLPALLAGIVAPWWGWVSVAAAVVLGPLWVWLGVRLGGARLDRTWPEVLRRVTWQGS